MSHTHNASLPIGVFDSGVGGLTVLRALCERLPNESLIYLGDTARLPYGTKSTETVTRYALQTVGKLVERRVKLLVVACNTATAAALPRHRRAQPRKARQAIAQLGQFGLQLALARYRAMRKDV